MILHIDMSNLTIKSQDVPEEYKGFGGRGLTSLIINREVPPTCHPLGIKNKLILAPGLLAGTMAPSSGRLSIGAKSPLTNGIKESNAGGMAGQYLGKLGIKAIVIEGKADRLYYAYLGEEKKELVEASDLKGLGNYDTVGYLQKKYGKHVAIVSIGQVGEMCLCAATVAVTDMDGRPTRHAGRGGLGAVMGSKGLKAIVIDPKGAKGVVYADEKRFKEAAKRFSKALREHPGTGELLPTLGSNSLMKVVNGAGALPTRYFKTGQFERVDDVSGERQTEIIRERGGKIGHPCQAGCVIRCSRIYVDKEGKYITKGPEYETIWAHGPNLGISDLDAIARMDYLADDYGIDTIEMGNAIGVAMEAGIISFGDIKGVMGLYEEVSRGTPLGRILGSGAATVAKVFGISRVAVVKGQALPAYDPRAVKGIGVTYATSPMGADHTSGYTVRANILGIGEKVDPLAIEGQVELSKKMQVKTAALDCTGLCLFCTLMMAERPDTWDDLVEMINARYGLKLKTYEFFKLGERVLEIEHDFNRRAGFTKADDRLPEFFYNEPFPPHNTVFDIPDEELDRIYK
ncbi:MAG: aldehyde ferredoxin oxidoreductase [Deltaproteobacteria bacterium]|nr:aldehyde ferredoxin oxidoreductase [Deltaproteobacteria bacterium]